MDSRQGCPGCSLRLSSAFSRPLLMMMMMMMMMIVVVVVVVTGPRSAERPGRSLAATGLARIPSRFFFFWKINSFISLFARAAPFAGPANGDEYGARNAHWDKKGNGSTVVALSTDPDRQLGKRTKKPSKQCRTQSTHRRARTDFSHGTNPSSNESNLLICSLYYNTIVLCQQKHRVSVNHEGRCTSRVRWEN